MYRIIDLVSRPGQKIGILGLEIVETESFYLIFSYLFIEFERFILIILDFDNISLTFLRNFR